MDYAQQESCSQTHPGTSHCRSLRSDYCEGSNQGLWRSRNCFCRKSQGAISGIPRLKGPYLGRTSVWDPAELLPIRGVRTELDAEMSLGFVSPAAGAHCITPKPNHHNKLQFQTDNLNAIASTGLVSSSSIYIFILKLNSTGHPTNQSSNKNS